MTMIERMARAISEQDEAGWAALPENDRERLYGGGKWHDEGRTQDDYRQQATAALRELLQPTEGMVHFAHGHMMDGKGAISIYTAAIQAALEGE